MLSSGVDSLYVSFRGDVSAERLDELEVLKASAQETGQPSVLAHGARKAIVQPSGWGSYRYWLRCRDFDVFVGRAKSLPAVYARLASSFIHEVGPNCAIAELKSFVEFALQPQGAEAVCSRVDIYADFQGWVPRQQDYERFVTRSRRNTSHVAIHHDGRQFTGFTFGRDAIVARLYDKGAEIAHSGKDWMRAVWGDRLDPSLPIWRIEFQLRREVLAECSLKEPEEVVRKRQDLWSYATQWLSLRSPRSGERRTRWPVAGAWVQLSLSELGARQSSLVRQRIRKREESVLVRGLAGYASSLAAVAGVSDLDVAMLVGGAAAPRGRVHGCNRPRLSRAGLGQEGAPGVTLQWTLEWSVDTTAIDRVRILRGWTRRDLAHEAHVDEGTLCDLFAGRRRPTFGTLRALCQVLGLSLEDVIAFTSARQQNFSSIGSPASDPCSRRGPSRV
ncbi:MAG: helix-turn-helix domain-containing protein [Candidatus Dormibacterales bacterium]